MTAKLKVFPDRIKLLVMCGSLSVGGAEVQAARLLPKLDKNLFDVHVAYYNANPGFPERMLREAGIPIQFLGKTKWSKSAFFQDLITYLKREKFDMMHAWFGSSNHYGCLTSMLLGIPVIVGGFRGKRGMTPFWNFIYSLMSFRMSGWIVNSQELKKFARQNMLFSKNVPFRIVLNGIPLLNHKLGRTRSFYDSIKSEKFVIGIVGRLHPVKNHYLFLEMADILTSQGIIADYWIIGDGELRNELEERITRLKLANRVKMLGLRHDVSLAFRKMDIAVLTSNSESCPNTLLEAMEASLPVISTNCTSSLDLIIQEGVNGYITPVGDARALANKAALLLADPIKRKKMGEYSRKIIEAHYSIESAAKSLEEAYIYFLRRNCNRTPKLMAKMASLGLA